MKIATSTERINELFDADSRNDSSIARALGVSRQCVSSWRTGVRSPKKPMLIKIADEYNVSIEWLMGFDVAKDGKNSRSILIPDAGIFKKLINSMEFSDYQKMMEILERTEKKLKAKGEL